jgi:hypothetical protein
MYFLRWYLWIGPNVLLGIFLAAMVMRGHARQFPALLRYIIFQLALFIGLVLIVVLATHSMSNISTYRWVLLLGVGASSVLELALIYQIANFLITPISPVARALRSTLQWAAGLLILIAVPISASFSQNGTQRVLHVFEVLNFSTYLINLGVLVALLLFTRVLRISWKSFAAGIALGLGIDATVEIASTTALSAFGARGFITVDVMRMAAFHAQVVIWLIYAFLPDRAAHFEGAPMGRADIEDWNEQLRRMVQR